jgi:hypothetical protein
VTTRPADGVSPEGTWWASVSTTVGDRDVPELVIPLSPGVRLRGRVAFDGATDRLEPGRWLFVEAADGERFVSRFSGDFSAWVSGTGEFLTPELPPGRYVVRFFPGRRWTLSTVTANGRDVADGIEIGSDPAPELLVRLSDSPSRVSGTIRNSRSGGDVDATVLAFPLDRRLWTGYGETPWRLQIVRTDRRGAYALTGLPAGTYAIVAVPDAQTADWPAPEFLARLAPVATRVEIAAGEQKTLDLQSVVVR